MNLFRKISAVTAAVIMLASCGGGGGGAKVSLLGEDVETGMLPNPNGFAFANFASSASPEVFDASDIVKMFGSSKDVCVNGADPCQLVAEAAAWARMVNDARASGHCEGFAVTSASRFTSAETPITAELTNKGDVTHGLMRAFATQFLKEVQDDTKSWAGKSLKEKVAALEASFAKKSLSYSLGVYTDTGGHAVLPYALEYVTPTKVKIKIYDSNWPGKDRYVSVDLDAETWSFAFSGSDPANDPNMWTGGSKDLDLTSMTARTSGSCPFCSSGTAVTNTMLLVRSASLDWSVKTADGTLSPQSTSAGSAEVRPLRAATGSASPTDFIVTVPAGEKMTMNFPSVSKVTGLTATSAVQIETPGSPTGEVVLTDSSVSANDANISLTLADGNLVGTSNGENNSLSTSGEQIEMSTTTASGEVVKVEVNEENPAVEIVTSGDGMDAKSDYEVLIQKDENTILKKTVDINGSEKTSEIQGQLDNTKESVPLPKGLEAPVVKEGLPSEKDRELTEVKSSDVSSSVPSKAENNSALPTLRPVAKPPTG